MPRAPRHKKNSHPGRPTIEAPLPIRPTSSALLSNIPDIPSSPPAFPIKAHSSPQLPPIRRFSIPQTSNRARQPQSTSFYSTSFRNTPERADALLFAAFQAAEESDKDDIGMVGIGNGSIELDAQTELKRNFAFLAEDFFSDESLEEDTNWKTIFQLTTKGL